MRDIFNTDCLDGCLLVTGNMCGTYRLKAATADGFCGRATAYVWNLGTWRAVLRGERAEEGRSPEYVVADTAKVNRPVLFTMIRGDELRWALQQPSATLGSVTMEPAVCGQCLRWNDFDH